MRATTLLIVVGVVSAAMSYPRIAAFFAPEPAPFAPADGSVRVEMYTTRSCGYCSRARRFLDRHRVPYQDHQIDRSSAARARFSQLGGRGVPLFVIEGETFPGYSERWLSRKLGL